jgi:hypothetical protein
LKALQKLFWWWKYQENDTTQDAQFLDQGFSLFRVVSEISKVVHIGSLARDDVIDASSVTGRLDGSFLRSHCVQLGKSFYGNCDWKKLSKGRSRNKAEEF